jgi:signal transduction histidine kinase
LTSGLLGTVITDEDGQVIHWFTDQLALVLDGTELLGRVVTIERSLAHAEKLSAIGELAARVAHEIRNPVTAARSLAQSLCREPTSPLNTEHAGLILGELERVERQIAALLRFARREDLHLEAVDLGALARETVRHLHPRLQGAGIGCDLEAPEGIVAHVDREKIRQVLINLIENSIDALAEADGDRRIALHVARANGHARVRVADTGPGVPEESLPRIFEPFFSLKSHGTGLGLAIVKRTIEAHGGQVAAEGSPGHGLSLEVALPLESHV